MDDPSFERQQAHTLGRNQMMKYALNAEYVLNRWDQHWEQLNEEHREMKEREAEEIRRSSR